MAVALIVVGFLIAGGSFAFAAINMGKHVYSMFDDKAETDSFTGFGGMFKRHIGAMVGMMVGGLIAAIGVVIGVVQIVQTLAK